MKLTASHDYVCAHLAESEQDATDAEIRDFVRDLARAGNETAVTAVAAMGTRSWCSLLRDPAIRLYRDGNW